MNIERFKPELIPGTTVDLTRDFSGINDAGEVIADYDDVITKKLRIRKIFEEDPDLKEMLGMPEPIPIIDGMSEDQKIEIEDRNDRIGGPEIIPWLKLNGVVKTVSNKVLFDVLTERGSYDNPAFLNQHVIVMCLVDETSMDTDYGIPRVDLVAYIVKDLLNRSDYFGKNMVLWLDEPKIVDNSFYCRELRFRVVQPNFSNSMLGNGNKYDNFKRGNSY